MGQREELDKSAVVLAKQQQNEPANTDTSVNVAAATWHIK